MKNTGEKHFETAVVGAKSLKAAMRIPDSLVLESVRVRANGTICYRYRAKDGLGEYAGGQAIYLPGMPALLSNNAPNFAAEWEKGCAGHGSEYVRPVTAAM